MTTRQRIAEALRAIADDVEGGSVEFMLCVAMNPDGAADLIKIHSSGETIEHAALSSFMAHVALRYENNELSWLLADGRATT